MPSPKSKQMISKRFQCADNSLSTTTDMNVYSVGELINMAIGLPEPGHVNFAALQCVLFAISEKMEITDDKIDMQQYGRYTKSVRTPRSSRLKVKRTAYASIIESTKASLKYRSETSSSNASDNSLTNPIIHTSRSSPKMHRALTAIIEHTFQGPILKKGKRLKGGADEPPPEPTEAVADAVEEASPNEAPSEAPAAEAESAPAPEAEIPVDDTAPVEIKEEQAVVEESVPVEEPQKIGTVPVETSIKIADVVTVKESMPFRLSQLELSMNILPEELRLGISIMKDQLDLAMEELNILTTLMINNKVDPQRISQLRAVAARLRSIQRDNVFIEGTHRAKFDEKSISWLEGEVEDELEGYEEAIAVEEEVEAEVTKEEEKSSTHSVTMSEQGDQDQYDLDLHLCYSPDKMLEQVIEMKSEICNINNKINDIAAEFLKHDSHRTMSTLCDIQEQVREMRQFTVMARDTFDRLENDRVVNARCFDEFRNDIMQLKETKIDKCEVQVLLAEKVDYQQLARKVNTEQLQQLQCRMEHLFCEAKKLICITERSLREIIEDMRASLGFQAIEGLLKKFKETIDADIHAISEKLQKYIDATNDEGAAAGARVKVLQDLACISCDTECVMRTAERNKLVKLKDAHVNGSIAPLVTYELSSIRKSGVMGYYRKDEFPPSGNAWLKRQDVNASLKMCVPRHSGGPHTTYTAKDKIEKIMMLKK